jgi:heptosyltransferase-2
VLLTRFSSLGDVVLATAAVEALREDLPEAEVHVLTKPAFADVFRNNPGVARVMPWDPGDGMWVLARHIRAGGYDWVVDLHRNLRTTGLRALTPGVRWCGYPKGAWRRRFALWLRRPALLADDHVVDRYVAALAPLGVTAARRLPRVHPGEEDRARVRQLLLDAGWDGEAAAVGLGPGARWATKAWPEERWRALTKHLRGRGFPVLLGGTEDGGLASRILDGERGANLAGETSVLETAAALELCRVLVTNDSAPLHLATAVGTPVVALFGPTVRGLGFYPMGKRDVLLERDLPCRPCSLHGGPRCPLVHHDCLRGISVQEVVAAIGAVAETGERRAPVP